MAKEIKNSELEIVNIKRSYLVLKKRKWWFLGVFLTVFLIGVFFSIFFANNYQYEASTILTLPSENLKYQRIISEEYPQEAGSLWLMGEGGPSNNFFNHRLMVIISEINSEDFMRKVAAKLDHNPNPKQLERRISISHKGNDHHFIINTFGGTQNDALGLNEIIIETYTNEKEESFQEVYGLLLDKVKTTVLDLEEELATLSVEAEEYLNTLDISSLDSKDIYDKEEEIILPPELQAKVKRAVNDYNYYNDILDNLKNNEEFYTGSLKPVGSTVVSKNYTYFRNIILSILAAVLVGAVVAHIIDYIKQKIGCKQ